MYNEESVNRSKRIKGPKGGRGGWRRIGKGRIKNGDTDHGTNRETVKEIRKGSSGRGRGGRILVVLTPKRGEGIEEESMPGGNLQKKGKSHQGPVKILRDVTGKKEKEEAKRGYS